MAYSNNAQIELTRESIELERRLLPITQEMNAFPLRVNKLTWQVNTESAEESANFLTDYCRYLADDDEFRPNSTADCARALFENRGVKPTKLSKKSGRPLTDVDVLSELGNQGVILATIIGEARSAITRWGQLKAWKPYAEAGQVQTVWDSMGCPHGRYTSDNPCLTNRISPIRGTIEADPGYSFLSLDLSQAEYCTWASLSGDPTLSQLFQEGRDFHTEMARSIREAVPSWDLRGETERQAGKTLNFSILYLMQPHTLARKLGCTTETASRIIGTYHKRASTAALYIKCVLAAAKQTGYVETFYGRRRYCHELQEATGDREIHEVQKTLWSHVNAGTAAEFLKWKQVKTWEALRSAGLTPDDVRLSLQIFDELIFHVRNDCLKEVQEIAEGIFREQEPGFLPFKVGVKSGKTWGECE